MLLFAYDLPLFAAMTSSADDDYKSIFSHPDMVEDIITHFTPGPWLDDIDFATLEPYKSSFVADFEEPDTRHSDLIWRVRCKGTWLYVYLLFEFQSSINKYMALRMLVYVGLLYQDLIKNKCFDPDGKLPFILPIVLYNGTPRWNAALNTRDLIAKAPQGLQQFLPNMAYFPIDEGSYTAQELEKLNSLAAIVFLLESQTTMQGLHKGMDLVLKWPGDEKQQTLYNAIANVVTRVWSKKLPNVPMPRDDVNDLRGVFSMLSENIDIIIANEVEERTKARLIEEEERTKARLIEEEERTKARLIEMEERIKARLEQSFERDVKEAKEKGMEKGERLGNAAMFKAMVAIRFGPLTEPVSTQIDAANEQQLLMWGEKLFGASSLDEVFGPN